MGGLIFLATIAIIIFASKFTYDKLVKKEYIKKTINPYTKKDDMKYFIDYLRVIIFIILTIYSFFFFKWIIGLIFLFVTSSFAYVVYKSMEGKHKEEEIFTWEYTGEEILQWKKEFKTFKKVVDTKIKKIKTTNVSKKIVATNLGIYLSASKKYKFIPEPLDNLKFYGIEIKENFIVLTYSLMAVPVTEYCIFIPDGKRKEAEKLIGKIKQKNNR
jgi:hypothetical protein